MRPPQKHGPQGGRSGRPSGGKGGAKAGGTRKPRPAHERPAPPDPAPERFRVLLAVHRPRYRSRAERAVALPGWEVRSLLNREDPIGLLNQKPPHLFIVSVDAARSIHTGYLRAAQRYRGPAMRIVVLGETQEDADGAADQCEEALAPPWRTEDLRAIAARLYQEMRGEPPEMPEAREADDGS